MSDVLGRSPDLIVPLGTQVVLRTDLDVHSAQVPHPRGTVVEIVRTPDDVSHAYRVKVPDGTEFSLRWHEGSILKRSGAVL